MQTIILRFMSKSVLPMFSSGSFLFFDLTFRSLIHFELIFAYGVKKCSNLFLLHVVVQVSLWYSIFFFTINLFIYFWLHWVFVAACGLSLVTVNGGYSWLWCAGFSLQWLLLLRSMGSRRMGSVVVARGL